MANWTRNAACPRCRESGRDVTGDNLAEYDNGSARCWSCNYRIKGNDFISDEELNKKLLGHCYPRAENYLNFPEDFSYHIPPEPLAWLKQYGITNQEILDNNIGFSKTGIELWSGDGNKQLTDLLIFPIFDDSNVLLMWQGRAFGEIRKPKYITKGYKSDVLHLIGQGDTLVLVEDMVSAIKVGRHACAMPIFGAEVSEALLVRLCLRNWKHIHLWLDYDKADYAIKRSNSFNLIYPGSRAIITEDDPKNVSDAKIKELIE